MATFEALILEALRFTQFFVSDLSAVLPSNELVAALAPWTTTYLAMAALAAIALVLCARHYLVKKKKDGVGGDIEIEDSGVDEKLWMQMFNLAKTSYIGSNMEKLTQLIDTHGIDINSYREPKTGLTLLLCACLSGKTDVVKLLLDKGSEINVTTIDHDSPLLLATYASCTVKQADPSLVDLLACRGLNVNAQNSRGDSPLAIAALHGRTQLISVLLQYGADPFIPNHSGILPIDFAGSSGNIEAAKLLESHMHESH